MWRIFFLPQLTITAGAEDAAVMLSSSVREPPCARLTSEHYMIESQRRTAKA